MTHWMEGDCPDESDDDKAVKRLLQIAKQVVSRASIANDHDDELLGAFEQAIDDVDALFESNDPRSMGWVGDDGLP